MTGPAVLPSPPQARAGVHEAVRWLRQLKPEIRALLGMHGAVLVKGLPVDQVSAAEAIRDVLIDRPMSDREPFAARQSFAPGLFAEYPWPRDQTLCPQHAQSYQLEIPRLVLSVCLQPAAAGGEALLADSRQVLNCLPPALVEQLWRHGWLMIRNFAERVGVSWQDAYNVTDRESLQRHLRQQLIWHEWHSNGCLQTARLRSAVIHHPDTGEACFFNHLSFFSEHALASHERAVLQAILPDGLMLNTLIGDGTALTAETIALIDRVYDEVAVPVGLEAGDLLLIDNILMGQGRRPFAGKRAMLTAMGDPVSLADCCPSVSPALAPARMYLNGL